MYVHVHKTEQRSLARLTYGSMGEGSSFRAMVFGWLTGDGGQRDRECSSNVKPFVAENRRIIGSP